MRKTNKLFIGTSGWAYSHWEGIFYPPGLRPHDKLRHFSRYFKTVEINYSFYRLPKVSVCQRWYAETPADFVFAVKASRFITHIKRLKEVKTAWKVLLENALGLKEKLGPILLQFPPNFKATEENIKRLEKFGRATSEGLRVAAEFRDGSWFDEKIYELLKEHKVAWVMADSPEYPKAEIVTADFVYIRLHGSKTMFSSKYTKKELQDLARRIREWQKQDLDVYCYFNNDERGFAVENAKELIEFL